VNEEILLTETTVGSLGDARVGVANMLEEGDGVTAQLFVSDSENGPFIVGVGSVFDAGGSTWEVERIEKEPGRHGTVAVRPTAS
jgi:Family of unknown function (DUF6406)